MTTLECRLINAAIACYAISKGQIPQGNANAKAIGLAPNTWPKVFVNGLDEINAGFVAETDDGWVVLALRGTLPPFKGDLVKWVLDWLQDFEAGPTNWYVGGRVFGRVETGFANATLSIWPQAMAALSQIDLSAKKGHSGDRSLQGRGDDLSRGLPAQDRLAASSDRELLFCRAAYL